MSCTKKKSYTINSISNELVMIAESGAFDGEISFTFAGHSGAGLPLVLEAGDADVAADDDADSDKENVPPPPSPPPTAGSPPHPSNVALVDHAYADAPPSGGTGRPLPPSSSASSLGTVGNGEFLQGVSGLLALSGVGGGSPREGFQCLNFARKTELRFLYDSVSCLSPFTYFCLTSM